MRLFDCQACGHQLYFEDFSCGSCGRRLGFVPEQLTLSALEPNGDRWTALASPKIDYSSCANLSHHSCNWLLPADSGESYCIACRHNRTIPAPYDDRNLALWRKIETAKRRLFYSLLRLKLPLETDAHYLADLKFDFLAPADNIVMTGHLDGLITINLSEADDSERERQRGAMGEPYRTLLGHFRHEVAIIIGSASFETERASPTFAKSSATSVPTMPPR